MDNGCAVKAFLFATPLLLLSTVAMGQDKPQPKVRPDLDAKSFAKELAGIEREVKAKLKELHIPGAAVVIVKDGKVAMIQGYGYRDVEKKLPVTPETVFMI